VPTIASVDLGLPVLQIETKGTRTRRTSGRQVTGYAPRSGGHLAFGCGIHICFGRHLARAELKIALDGLLDRFPTLRLAIPAGDVMHPDDLGQAGPYELPVTW